MRNLSGGNGIQAINIKSKSDPIRVEQETQPLRREKSRTWEGIESADDILQFETGQDRQSKSLINFVQYMAEQEANQN